MGIADPETLVRVRRGAPLVVGMALALPTAAVCGALPAGCASGPAPARARRAVPTESPEAGPLEVRLNPASCPCPEWEVRVGDRWERVHVVDGSDDGAYVVALAARAEADDRAGVDGRYPVAAELTSGVRDYRDGHGYRILRIDGDPPPAEVEVPEAGDGDGAPPGEAGDAGEAAPAEVPDAGPGGGAGEDESDPGLAEPPGGT